MDGFDAAFIEASFELALHTALVLYGQSTDIACMYICMYVIMYVKCLLLMFVNDRHACLSS